MPLEMDVLVVGAGPSGLVCAAEAARRRRRTMVVEQSRSPGRKLLMTGGGRCNFTNASVGASDFVSGNPHFCKSALSRFTNRDFLAMLEEKGIPHSERDHGRLFCDGSASEVLDMLLGNCAEAGAAIRTGAAAGLPVRGADGRFTVRSGTETITAESLVIASGGLAAPSSGAGPYGYAVAGSFGIPVRPTRPGLVPLTLGRSDRALLSPLAGISLEVGIRAGGCSFRDALLFTHRGLSGPAALQASVRWSPGQDVEIDLLPGLDPLAELERLRGLHASRSLRNALAMTLPRRLADVLLRGSEADRPVGECSSAMLRGLAARLGAWVLRPAGTEGWESAEVTIGGVDCGAVSSRTMESRDVPGLYFVGEVLDVTGSLGGYNLQWAWSSGYCAGRSV